MAQRNTYFQNEIIEKKIDIKQLGRTLRYVIPYRKTFLLVGCLMILSALFSLISPILLGHIINNVVYSHEYRELVFILCMLAVLAIAEISITFAHQRLMGKTGHRIIASIRRDIFYKLQQLSFDYFDNRPAGKITVRVTDYINDLANFFTNQLLFFIIYIVKIVMVTIFMLVLSPQLTLIVFATVVPLMACIFWLRFIIRKRFALHRAKVSNRSAFVVESIMGEKIVKNYNRADINEKIYMDVHMSSIYTWWSIVKRNELNSPIIEIFWNLGTLTLYGVSLGLILNGSDTVNAGIVSMFISYMAQFSGPLTMVAMIVQNLAQVSSNLEQVFDTIDSKVEIADAKDAVEIKNVKGKVDFKDVTFAYEEGINILEKFNLNVKPGETIALVGPTGAGKTTVINMLTRFYDVKEGSVCIDGRDIREISLKSLREEVGVLMQDPFIFKGTVIDNIRYGKIDATDEECIAAAKMINADKWINRWPNGFYEELEERGGDLSAGEKQLISFARILLKNPSIVILDEATSSIDSETEKMIQDVLEVILKDKTAFIVAHRLSTIRNADRILYISNKGIAEEGTHEQLMEKKGLYWGLHQK